MKTWTPTDLTKEIPLKRNLIVLSNEEYFYIVNTPERIAFGGACNAGFLESGYIEKEEGERFDETLSELIDDLETYYRDGAGYVSRIVCNERM